MLLSPALSKVKAIAQELLHLHRASLPLALSRLIPSNKMVTAEAGAYSVKVQLNAMAFAASLSSDPFAADKVWEACRGSNCALFSRFPAAGANLYSRFNILHAVGEVLHGRCSSDGSPAPEFLKPDINAASATKQPKSMREAFTALFTSRIPADKQEDWQAFLKFLDTRAAAPVNLALSDAVLQEHLEEWELDIPFLLRKPDAPVARLHSLGDGAYSLDEVMALDNQRAICINQPASSLSSSGAKRPATHTTASVTLLSPPTAELRASVIAAVFAEAPDFFLALPPEYRCLATMGHPSSDPVTHE
jgi:hypothetical protein